MKILRFEEISSTNEFAKEKRLEREDLLILAKRQTGGKGTKGRSFSSNEGGVYLTKLVFYENFSAKDAFLIMARAAVAVCKTLEKFSLSPKIKWANDVFVADKKICGILIENVFSGNKISSSVIGVGLNVNNLLPDELKEIATTMREQAGKELDFSAVESALIENLNKNFSMEEYLSRVGYLNEEVCLRIGETLIPATPVCVEKDGALVVEIGGEKRRVFSGEVSLLVKRRER